MKMDIEVSIIILSHNRYPLNLFTLYSLKKQTFDLSKMEVIFIDDASTDSTPLLKDYHPPYPFKYVRNETNLGRSATRNVGLNMARGNIILLLDAEMIVHPDYVRNHHRHHLTSEQVVVIGRNSANLYTFLFPGFNPEQIGDICRLANKPLVKKRLRKRLKRNINGRVIRTFMKNLKAPIQLLYLKDIKTFSHLKSFSTPEKYINKLFAQLGKNLDKSYFSWMVCLGSLSLKKQLIDKVGGYDEDFKGWGTEDVEFAYRLYKAGAKFVVDPNLIRYHQEHPISTHKNREWKKNMVLLQQKHPVIEVCIKSLGFIQKQDYEFIDRILQEHKSLSSEFPGRFEDFKSSIVLLLRQIPILRSQNKQVRNLLQNSGIEYDLMRKELILLERNTIESYGEYENLIRLFDLLIGR
jgi:glycosyltransferase involved in cell wall biosynthesis